MTGTAKPIVDLIEQGNQVIIAHGNGPQVGMINLGMSTAAEAGTIKSRHALPRVGGHEPRATSATICRTPSTTNWTARGIAEACGHPGDPGAVDEADPAFQKPLKPIGAFLHKEAADKLAAEGLTP